MKPEKILEEKKTGSLMVMYKFFKIIWLILRLQYFSLVAVLSMTMDIVRGKFE